MLPLHPQFIEKDGRRESVILPYEEFEALVRVAQGGDALNDPTEPSVHEAAVKVEEAEAAEIQEAESEAEEVEPFLRL